MFARMLGVTEGRGLPGVSEAGTLEPLGNEAAHQARHGRLLQRRAARWLPSSPATLGLSSGNWHFGDMNAAIQRIPKHNQAT